MEQKTTPHTDWRAAWDRVNAERARLDLAPYGYEFANDTDVARLFCNVLKSIQSK